MTATVVASATMLPLRVQFLSSQFQREVGRIRVKRRVVSLCVFPKPSQEIMVPSFGGHKVHSVPLNLGWIDESRVVVNNLVLAVLHVYRLHVAGRTLMERSIVGPPSPNRNTAFMAIDGFGGTVPAVFVLRGDSVVSSQADTEPGDPMFANVINRMIPASLQSAANGQQIPNADALSHQASVLGGC